MRLTECYSGKSEKGKEKYILKLEEREEKGVGHVRTPAEVSRSLYLRLRLRSCCQQTGRTSVEEEQRSRTKMTHHI